MNKSIFISKFGGPKVLTCQETSSPALTAGGVRIKVRAAGVNFADLQMRMGLYPEAPRPPFVPGYEIAGEVLEIADDLRTDLRVGDRVVAPTRFGGYTSEIVLPESYVRKIPANLSFEEAAAIPVVFLTAWFALHDMCRIRNGDRVLIQSAAGGVGTAAVQIAAQAGAHVVGIVGSENKIDQVKALGADEVWTRSAWEHALRGEAPKFDAILDSEGGKSLKKSFESLAPLGRVVTFGVSSAVGTRRSIFKLVPFLLNTPLFPPFKLMMANKGVFGLNVLQLVDSPEIIAKSFDQILSHFHSGNFKAVVGKTFPLEDAAAAHQHLMSRQNIGKVILTVG